MKTSGRETFICRYRADGVRRQYTLGRHGVLTVDQARQEARRILRIVSLGNDPELRAESSNICSFQDMPLIQSLLADDGSDSLLYQSPQTIRGPSILLVLAH